MTDNPRRLLLRLGVKLFSLLSVALVAFVLLSSVEDDPAAEKTRPESLKIRLTPLDNLRFSRQPWEGGNLILLRYPLSRRPAAPPPARLLDPLSKNARQPDGLSDTGRSLHAGLFLAYDRGTDMGCPLTWIAAGNSAAPMQPWPGGFRDSCNGSWYDAAGRVFKDQQAQRNLDIPPYRLIAPDLLEVGVNGDNPASVK
jgi:ubiquinol-cytochrome c reductase iron-sulfur subunit